MKRKDGKILQATLRIVAFWIEKKIAIRNDCITVTQTFLFELI